MREGRLGGMIDETHDPARTSWVTSANRADGDFPIQNLPFGIFSNAGTGPRGGVAIGDAILDLAAAANAGLFEGEAAEAAQAASGPVLNRLLALGPDASRALRRAVSRLLESSSPAREELLHEQSSCTMHLPVSVPNYTDFYAGIYHATAATKILRPGQSLPANYKWVPIGYHGRASSVQVSGGIVQRPSGQRRPDAEAPPVFGPTTRLDLELELGVFVGQGNALGEPIPIGAANRHIFGLCLLNDWSARDIQAWEVAPLGPFLAKNFYTTISPWIVTQDALAPFRIPAFLRNEEDPAPLDYLSDEQDRLQGGLDIDLRVAMRTKRMRDGGENEIPIITSNAQYLYWTPAQMLAHHSSGGCNMQPGDLLGTGTISGPSDDQLSSLMELTQGGAKPFTLPNGEKRGYLENGDEIVLTARCERDGFVPIGFGECRGTVAG